MTGAPPHGAAAAWHVGFWVDDVDATAAAAAELGGAVLEPPSVSPVGTIAVLADPGGAAFTVSSVPRGQAPSDVVP
jgi:predicted enzyme related to lactoylglutathione lyase